MSVSAARSRVVQAQSLMDSRRYDEVPAVVETGLGFLVGLPEEETAEMMAQLTALRDEAVREDVLYRAQSKIRAAQRELDVAKEDIERGNVVADGITFRFDKALQYVEEVPADLKAEVLDQVDMLRTIMAARTGGAPAPAAGSAPAAPALSEDVEANLRRARGRITQVRSMVESGRTEGSDAILDEAAGMLEGAPEQERAGLLAEIEAARGEAVAAEQAAYARTIANEFDRHFYTAEDTDVWKARYSGQAIAHLTERLADGEVRRRLPADTLAQYESRLAAARAARSAALKDASLERALPIVAELAERVATDPFAGLDESSAYNVQGQLDHLQSKIRHELSSLDQQDPDVLAIGERVAAARAVIETASRAWGVGRLHAAVRERWTMVERDPELAGWREEELEDHTRLLGVPELPRTRTAVMRIGWLLADPQTAKDRAENEGDEVVEATYRAAEEERAAAVAKIAEAYHAVLATAEEQPAPTRSDDLHLTMHFSGAVETTFAGTTALQALLDRTEALNQRWQDEVAGIAQGRQELSDRLAAEAVDAWPAIVAATGASTDFDPGDTTAAGRTVHLQGVRNRAGWDFKDFDFALRRDGIPVGGTYDPQVAAALEHAWYTLKLDVSDRVEWDVIGVIQGAGKIGQRSNSVVRGSNGLEIGKIEEWKPVECVRLKIIGLHAGPVAVGPDHPWKPEA